MVFDHIVKIDGRVLECNLNTLNELFSGKPTVGKITTKNKKTNIKGSGWFSTGGLRGFKKAGGDVVVVKNYILKNMKNGSTAEEITLQVDNKWGAAMDKNVCYKIYKEATPKVTRRK